MNGELLPLDDPAGEAARPGLLARLAVDVSPPRESRPFRRLWLGQAVSQAGNAITMVAIPYPLFPACGDHFGGGARTVGYLYAAPYVGALAASLLSGWVDHARRQGLGVCVAAGLWGVAIALFGLSGSLRLALAFLALAGAADFVSAVLRSRILYRVTPDSMRGRLSGIERTQVASAPSVGNLEAGVLASLTSLRFSVVAGGAACVVDTVVLALALPRFVRHTPGSE